MDIAEIHKRASGGPRALLARRVFAVAIGLATTVVIPHFVPPSAYGLAAMSAVIFGLAEMFKDFGLTSALLRKGDIHPEEVTFLFWFNLATTLALAAAIAAVSPLAALFFHEPKVAPIMLASLIGFVTGGLCLQHRGLLTRDLRFADLAAIDSGVLLIQFTLTLAVAALTHDVWAIVAGSVASSLAGALLAVRVSGWRPGPPRWLPQANSLLAFGANTSVYALSIFVSNNIATFLIGRLFGSATLGQYNRAVAIQIIPANNAVAPLAQATLPVLARLGAHPGLYRATYVRLVRQLNMLVLPTSVALVFMAKPLAVAVLGPAWTPSGDLLQALAPAIAALGFGYAAGDLFITQDRSAELRSLGLAELAVRVAGIAAAARFGVVAVAASFSATTLLVVVVRVLAAGRKGPVSAADHFVAAGPGMVLALGAALGCVAGQWIVQRFAMAALSATVLLGLWAAIAGCAMALALPPSRRALLEMVRTLRGSVDDLEAVEPAALVP